MFKSFKIQFTDVTGITDAVRYSGLPKNLEDPNFINSHKSFERAEKLSQVPNGSGHDCFLKGITVRAFIDAPQYFWMQWMRYHFQDIISSQSKMHMIKNMNISEQSNEFVDSIIIQRVENYVEQYKKGEITIQEVVSNVPMGLYLGAGIVTNYLQLKSIYSQRKNHKLPEWHLFCEWIEDLPYSRWITG